MLHSRKGAGNQHMQFLSQLISVVIVVIILAQFPACYVIKSKFNDD